MHALPKPSYSKMSGYFSYICRIIYWFSITLLTRRSINVGPSILINRHVLMVNLRVLDCTWIGLDYASWIIHLHRREFLFDCWQKCGFIHQLLTTCEYSPRKQIFLRFRQVFLWKGKIEHNCVHKTFTHVKHKRFKLTRTTPLWHGS